MIVKENIVINDKQFQKTYSDLKVKIKQVETQAIYDVAIDITPCRFTYEETDIPVPKTPEEDEQEYNDIVAAQEG